MKNSSILCYKILRTPLKLKQEQQVAGTGEARGKFSFTKCYYIFNWGVLKDRGGGQNRFTLIVRVIVYFLFRLNLRHMKNVSSHLVPLGMF